MNYAKAKTIVQHLANGRNPTKPEEELPSDSPLQSVDVVRALVLAGQVLADAEARAYRNAQRPPRAGKGWTDEEDKQLVDGFHSRKPLEDLATEMGRSLRSLEARLQTKGLITADQRTTTDRFDS